jgi:hypothetical protein
MERSCLCTSVRPQFAVMICKFVSTGRSLWAAGVALLQRILGIYCVSEVLSWVSCRYDARQCHGCLKLLFAGYLVPDAFTDVLQTPFHFLRSELWC